MAKHKQFIVRKNGAQKGEADIYTHVPSVKSKTLLKRTVRSYYTFAEDKDDGC